MRPREEGASFRPEQLQVDNDHSFEYEVENHVQDENDVNIICVAFHTATVKKTSRKTKAFLW